MKDFKYTREDFGELPVLVKHMDLDFDVYEDHTDAMSKIEVSAKKDLQTIELNAKGLDIHAVSCYTKKDISGDVSLDCTFEYKKDKDLLYVYLSNPVEKGQTFFIETKSTCYPTENILEGLYYDVAPCGCAKQMITQCQQWGFQRIVPCFDDMTAKCTYTTKITADVSYTHLLSNGDVSKERVDTDTRATIHYDNTKTPMATYLFFLGVGTYAGFTQELEYANGKKFTLELLVPPDSDSVIATKALQILHDGIQWVNIFTGPSTYEHVDVKHKIWDLIKKRNALSEGDEKDAIRKELLSLCDYISGYEYTGTVYREIGMQKSDFGGMENVGNTTVTTNRIMPFFDMTDGAFEYMLRVKTHEFYHNLNGSEVTGWSPFEIWLNEAVTVHIEQDWHAFLMGDNYVRLDTVQSLLAPSSGVLEQDVSASIMPIEPEGFNDCNELISHVTYIKAPEFVRMVQELLGKEQFVQALHLYHTRFKHSNAHSSDWIAAMEEVSGLDLKRFAKVWLSQTGYPIVHITKEYIAESSTLVLHVKQEVPEGKDFWEFPFPVTLCDDKGNILAQKQDFIQEQSVDIIFENVVDPAFISVNNQYTMYGKVLFDQSEEALYLQARHDSDVINRYIAFYTLADREKMRLLKDTSAVVSDSFLKLYADLLQDEKLLSEMGSSFLALMRGVESPEFRYDYQKTYGVVRKIRKAIVEKHESLLRSIYDTAKSKTFDGTYVEKKAQEMKNRSLKNLCLSLLCELDTQEFWDITKEQYLAKESATDMWVGFQLFMNSSAPGRDVFLREQESFAKENLVRWESFLGSVALLECDEVLDFISIVTASDMFDLNAPNDQRAIYARFAMNRRKSLQTEPGRQFLLESILKLTPINEYTTGHLLEVLGSIDKMSEEYWIPLIEMLKTILEKIDGNKYPSVYNTTKRLLKGAPKAHAKYVAERG
ncbi:MAG: aminopeptidase N C-terminal domain-containing protein [Candidatus Woesearchaeota archaeon]